MSSGNPIFTVKLPYKVRCNLPECGKPVNVVFKQNMEGMMNTFCSPHHARIGEERWNEKKDVRIGVPPQKTNEEYVADNIQDIEEEVR